MKITKHLIPLFLLVLAGCVSSPQFTESGIPESRYRIGGGEVYRGFAPKDGDFFVVEETTKKIIITLPVKKGQPIDYELREDALEDDPEGFESMYGIPYSDARFSAYFIP